MLIEYKEQNDFNYQLPVAYQLEMHRIIETSAYLKAESDGFKRAPIEYWLEAERELAA